METTKPVKLISQAAATQLRLALMDRALAIRAIHEEAQPLEAAKSRFAAMCGELGIAMEDVW
jgi:hypothetical protein